MPYTLAEINRLSQSEFVEALGWVFEHSPWVAERAWDQRPFASLDDLCTEMNVEVLGASEAEQVELLRAHPDLGTRARISESSAAEQNGAGLDQLTGEEYEHLNLLNITYKAQFGFPFLYAVKGSTKSTILKALEERLQSNREAEFRTALEQVFRIARHRLEEIVN